MSTVCSETGFRGLCSIMIRFGAEAGCFFLQLLRRRRSRHLSSGALSSPEPETSPPPPASWRKTSFPPTWTYVYPVSIPVLWLLRIRVVSILMRFCRIDLRHEVITDTDTDVSFKKAYVFSHKVIRKPDQPLSTSLSRSFSPRSSSRPVFIPPLVISFYSILPVFYPLVSLSYRHIPLTSFLFHPFFLFLLLSVSVCFMIYLPSFLIPFLITSLSVYLSLTFSFFHPASFSRFLCTALFPFIIYPPPRSFFLSFLPPFIPSAFCLSRLLSLSICLPPSLASFFPLSKLYLSLFLSFCFFLSPSLSPSLISHSLSVLPSIHLPLSALPPPLPLVTRPCWRSWSSLSVFARNSGVSSPWRQADININTNL